MKHPDDQYNQAQLKFLGGLSGEERLWHERMFRIGNAYTSGNGGCNHV